MKEEATLIKGCMNIQSRPVFGNAKGFMGTWSDCQVLVVQSGVGKKRASEAFKQVLEAHSPSLVISCGFAGGLHTNLKVGDVLVADSIIESQFDPNSEGFSIEPGVALDSPEIVKAKALLADFSFKIHSGPILTTDVPVCIPDKKKELGTMSSALGVDMETSALFEVAKQKSIPLISIRSISDTVDQELANFSPCFDENGNVSKIKAGRYVLTNPSLLPMAISLKLQTAKAVKNMTEFLGKFILHL